jgi:hypothetical protein
MTVTIRSLVALAIGVAAASAHAETAPGPNSGQQTRSIKALSDSEVKSLLDGSGGGFAKAAELNGYPGPAHVLELSAQLRLDASQEKATRDLLVAHKARASNIGVELIAAERELDALFAQKQADSVAVDRATQRVGLLQAQLRAEHLKTHLSQTGLLRPDQVHAYAVLRGYAPDTVDTGSSDPAKASHRHH